MRQQHKYVLLLVSLFLAMFLLNGCGGTNQHATVSNTSDTFLIETSMTLSRVSALNGSTLWSIPTQNLSQALAVTGDRVYYNTDSMVATVDLTTGHQLWTASLTGKAAAFVASGQMVYVLADNLLSAFDATTGTLKWHVDQVDENQTQNPFILNGNTIYTTVSGVVTALNAPTGNRLWQFVPPTFQNNLQPRVESLLLEASTHLLVISYDSAVYVVHSEEQPTEVWHLDPNSTDDLGDTLHHMTVLWSELTDENHLLLSVSFEANAQFELRYLALSTGSQVWTTPSDRPDLRAIGTSDFYTVGGPTNGNVSATTLNTHQQAWTVPGSGTYTGLFLSQGTGAGIEHQCPDCVTGVLRAITLAKSSIQLPASRFRGRSTGICATTRLSWGSRHTAGLLPFQ